MISFKRMLIALCLALLVTACAQAGPAPWAGLEMSQPRDQLTVAQLQQVLNGLDPNLVSYLRFDDGTNTNGTSGVAGWDEGQAPSACPPV